MFYAYTLDDIQDTAKNHPMALLYFTRPDCDECADLQPKIERLVSQHPKLSGLVVDLSKIPMAASRFSIYALPGVLVYVEGKPTISVVSEIDIAQLTAHVDGFYRELFFPA
ncbi:MAG TPA: thioredoxin family protein [Spirochaetia bacterium]|nr:thioredoxin family protein [Spirochaetia bacterium]